MKMMTFGAAIAALVAMPLAAQQGGQGKSKQAGTPHTVAGEMILYQDLNYSGEQETLRSPRTTVRTDWNIRSLAMHPGDRWQICARPRFRRPLHRPRPSVHDASLIGVEGRSAPPAGAGRAIAELRCTGPLRHLTNVRIHENARGNGRSVFMGPNQVWDDVVSSCDPEPPSCRRSS